MVHKVLSIRVSVISSLGLIVLLAGACMFANGYVIRYILIGIIIVFMLIWIIKHKNVINSQIRGNCMC